MTRKIILLLFSIILLTSCSTENGLNPDQTVNDDIYQSGTKQSFLERQYVGDLTYAELDKLGDFGLGTFNLLDGEMACTDNHFMRIPVSGVLNEAAPSDETFFAVVKFFNADQQSEVLTDISIEELKNYLDGMISDTSKPVAIKVSGTFNAALTRSIHKQSEPYKSLEEIVANQVTFDLQNVEGTIVGYWFPKYTDGVNFPGYHFHFLSKDLKHGGHLLDCEIKEVTAEVDYCDKFILQ